MKKINVLFLLLSTLAAASWCLAQNSHITPISTNQFLYSDTSDAVQSPTATPKTSYGLPPVWSTPLTQKHHKGQKRRQAKDSPTPFPTPSQAHIADLLHR
jgi:hypothetical protein